MLDKFSSPPDYTISEKYVADEASQTRDLRSPGYLKLAEKELSYRSKIIVLVILDALALWLSWSVVYAPNWQQFKVNTIAENSEIYSLFLTVLVFTIFLSSAFDLYRKGDKSRKLINSIKAVILSHLAVLPIVLRFYPLNLIYQIGIASVLAAL